MPERTDKPLSGSSSMANWTRVQIVALVLLTLVNLSNYLDRGVLAILQEPIKHDLHLQDWQLGLIGGPAFAVFYSVAGIPTARLADRIDRSRVLSIALAMWSLATALCGAAGGFVQLALARLGVGAGEGACSPVSHSLISDLFAPRQRGMALAILTTSIPIGHMMAPLIGAIAATALGWRMAFVAIGVPGIILAIVFRLMVDEPRHATRSANAPPAPATRFIDDLKLLAANPAFVWLFLATCFMGMAVTAVNVFTASFFLRTFHLSLGQAGLVIALGMGAAGFVGTFIGGWLADRFAGRFGRSYPLVVALAAALASVFFFASFNMTTLGAAFVFLLLANVASEMKNGPNYAAVQNMSPPHMRTTAAAIIMIAVVVIGGGLGPLLVGIVSDHAAARAFPTAFGIYAQACPGGRPAGASPLIAVCADAAAAGLRVGMIVPCAAYLIAAPLFIISARAIRDPLVY